MNSVLVAAMVIAASAVMNTANTENQIDRGSNDISISYTSTSPIREDNVVHCRNSGISFKCTPVLMEVVNIAEPRQAGVYTDQFYHMHNMWQGMDKKNTILNNTCYLQDCREVYNMSVSLVKLNEVPERDKVIYDKDTMLIAFKEGTETSEYFTEENSIKKLGIYDWYCRQLTPNAVTAGSRLYSLEAVAFMDDYRLQVVISMYDDETIPGIDTYGTDKVGKLNRLIKEVLSTIVVSESL